MDLYIFEDNLSSDLMSLFQVAYGSLINISFDCLKSKNKFREANYKLQNLPSDIEDVYIFIDLVPDNLQTSLIFSRMRTLNMVYERTYIIPLRCMEYYILKALKNSNLIENSYGYKVCMSGGLDYRNLMKSYGKVLPEEYNTYERFCKYVLDYYMSGCLSMDKRRLSNKSLYRKYYRDDCPCTSGDCQNMSRYEKSLEFIECLYLRPCRNDETPVSKQDMISLINYEIKRFNRLVSTVEEKVNFKGENHVEYTSL